MTESPFPQPTEHHLRLLENVGNWEVDCEYAWDPAQPPRASKARERVERVGDFWTVSLFEGEIEGRPFVGRATVGYDPKKRRWISTWIDSLGPFLFLFEGKFDRKGEVLTMRGKGPDPASGGMTRWRSTEQRVDPDRRLLELHMGLPDGSERKVCSYRYTRVR